MASEKALALALQNVALQNGYREGHYSIIQDDEHEFIGFGVQRRYRIVHSDEKTVLHLLVRTPPTSTVVAYALMSQEVRFFNNVHYLTKVQPLLKQYGVVPSAPKLYASSLVKNEEYLILEDLETKGFKRVNPSQGLNKAEFALVINTLSTFHLTVRYWKTRNLSEFNHLCGQFKGTLTSQNKDKFKDTYEVLLKKILNAVWVLSRQLYGNQLRKNIEDALTDITKKILKSTSDVREQSWATLANSSIWSPYLLFRYHTVTGGPIDVVFEDWSATRISSPVIDLSFIGLASSSTSLYPELQNMLDQYFATHLSKEELQRHYPIYGVYGMYGSLIMNVGAAFENEVLVQDFKSETLTEENSDVMPDIRTRVLSIVKTSIDLGII
ncbi:hypothetical protein GE061_016128 [Apolygus lucorum]|uniref:CHK kinase-like domain-containing protein n=1 Tax=Apolygus lucorum TaxID=248454 RepID=A0A6A4JNM5_APOLU|nr:hypothetical protein GE061_016128 [Apolygus lucorum]